jgi:hypothetical protein
VSSPLIDLLAGYFYNLLSRDLKAFVVAAKLPDRPCQQLSPRILKVSISLPAISKVPEFVA